MADEVPLERLIETLLGAYEEACIAYAGHSLLGECDRIAMISVFKVVNRHLARRRAND